MPEELIPYVPSIITFFIGLALGFPFGIAYAKQIDGLQGFHKGLISTVVIVLWSMFMAVDVYKGTNNTPLMLHLFFGAIIGTVNHEFGEWLLKFMKR